MFHEGLPNKNTEESIGYYTPYIMGYKSTSYTITYSEFRLLLLLDPECTQEARERWTKQKEWESSENDYASGPDNGEYILDLEHSYLDNRGFTVRKGDVVTHSFYESEEKSETLRWTYISNGETFTDLDWNLTGYGDLPREFQVPSPFPIMYWSWDLPFSCVRPNFEMFKDRMEFVSGEEMKRNGEYSSERLAALQWDYEGQRYKIYFGAFGGETYRLRHELTYEKILEIINDPDAHYRPLDDHTLKCLV